VPEAGFSPMERSSARRRRTWLLVAEWGGRDLLYQHGCDDSKRSKLGKVMRNVNVVTSTANRAGKPAVQVFAVPQFNKETVLCRRMRFRDQPLRGLCLTSN
jgi:hypothetical protein